MDAFLGEKIKMAKLQISTELSNSLEEAQLSGHGHRRDDMAKFFSREPKGDVAYPKLFDEVKQRVDRMNCKGLTADAVKKFQSRHGTVVVISGQPGIGKTTLTKRIVHEMWESSLFNPEIVFFIQFRYIDYETKTDLLQFLDSSVEERFPKKKDRMKILNKLKNCDNIYIVMDGLDEATTELRMNQPSHCKINSENLAEFYIQNLLSGNILPGSKKLVTSRPYAIVKLPEAFQPKVLFTIQGLDEDGLKQICFNICENDKNRCDKVLDHLNTYPDLKSYCYTPVLCIMVMESLDDIYSTAAGKANMDTITSIFVAAFRKWLKQKETSRFRLKNISNFAFEKFRNGEFYFRNYELREAKIDGKELSTFVYTFRKDFREIMYFVHLMWQEFLVAVKLRQYTKRCELTKKAMDNQEESLLSKLGSSNYEVVTRFLFGLCNKQTLGDLLDHIETEEGNTASDHKECEKILKDFAIEKLDLLRLAVKDEVTKEEYFKSILPILSWVHEAGDLYFSKQAAGCLKDEFEINSKTPFLSSDVPTIINVLQARDTKLVLNLSPRFTTDCSHYFFKELQTTLSQKPNIKVSTVNFE